MTNNDKLPVPGSEIDPEDFGVSELTTDSPTRDKWADGWSDMDKGLSLEEAEKALDDRNRQDEAAAKEDPDFWANQ